MTKISGAKKLSDGRGYRIDCDDGHGVEYWYDRNLKLWTITLVDPAGNQVGTATYEYKNRLKSTVDYVKGKVPK